MNSGPILTSMVGAEVLQRPMQIIIDTKQYEDMDVVQTLAELHNAHSPYSYEEPEDNKELAKLETAKYAQNNNIHRLEHSSPTNQLITITRDEDGVIDVHKSGNVSLDKGEEKLLKKIAKTASVRPLKTDKDAANASLDQEILTSIVRHEDEEATKKITMRELRHIIPQLIMRCYSISDEPYQRKVRGMWAEKPKAWPSHVPYCDPNNKNDKKDKPKKSTLMQMFIHLRNYYIANNKGVLEKFKVHRAGQNGFHQHQTTVVSPSEHSLAVQTITPTYTVPSTAFESHQVPRSPGSLSYPVKCDEESSPSPPEIMVSITGLKQEWDPESEIKERINTKIQWISSCQISTEDVEMLVAIRDVLTKMYQVRSQDHTFFLDVTHDFEATLDSIKVTGTFSEKKRSQWLDFYRKRDVPDVAASEQVLDISQEESVNCEPLAFGREEEVTADYQTLNIQLDDKVAKSQEAPTSYMNAYSHELNRYLSPDYDHTDNSIAIDEDTLIDKYSPENINVELVCTSPNDNEIGTILTTSNQITDCDYIINADTAPSLETMKDPHSCETSPLHDMHDEQVFPLSSCVNDIASDLYGDFLYQTMVGPSTNMVSTEAPVQPNSTGSFLQEEETCKLYTNMDMLTIDTPNDPDADRVKSMAQAYYNLSKAKENYNPTSPVPSPTTAAHAPIVYNNVIPLVVMAMENDTADQPDVKKRRTALKRRCPSSSLSVTDVTGGTVFRPAGNQSPVGTKSIIW